MNTSPLYYGLSSRVKLQAITDGHIAIVKLIKSRIIMKDALKIVTIAEDIQHKEPLLKVSLLCNNNICSKSVKLLEEKGIGVCFVEE